jgi:predicted GIY-YIG superfamily endonuclease
MKCASLGAALKREAAIKKMAREAKERLIKRHRGRKGPRRRG